MARPRVVRFSGELDVWKENEVAKRLADIDGSAPVVIDLSDVRYLDSAFVSALVRLRRRVPDVEITLAAPAPSVRRVLELTSMHELFTINDAPPPR